MLDLMNTYQKTEPDCLFHSHLIFMYIIYILYVLLYLWNKRDEKWCCVLLTFFWLKSPVFDKLGTFDLQGHVSAVVTHSCWAALTSLAEDGPSTGHWNGFPCTGTRIVDWPLWPERTRTAGSWTEPCASCCWSAWVRCSAEPDGCKFIRSFDDPLKHLLTSDQNQISLSTITWFIIGSDGASICRSRDRESSDGRSERKVVLCFRFNV